MSTIETETQTRLRRAKETLESNKNFENELRKKLAEVIESTKIAKEKYEELFQKEELEEVARKKKAYTHSTK